MIPFVLASIAAAAAAGVLNRRRVIRTIESEFGSRFGADVEAIVDGAEGFTLKGTTGRGLLLLHGSGDSPQSLRYLAGRLNAAGYGVHVPLLPGHGRTPYAFDVATANDYHDAVRAALAEVSASHPWVGVIGLSMGGALGARLVTESSGVRVLVLLAPYMIPPRDVRTVRGVSWLWSPLAPYLRGRGEASVRDPAARSASHAYGWFSARALEALTTTADAGRRALPKLALPILVIHSAQDNRIPRALAEEALADITAPVERHWLEGCGHVITVDYCKDTVAELVLAFLARHAG